MNVNADSAMSVTCQNGITCCFSIQRRISKNFSATAYLIYACVVTKYSIKPTKQVIVAVDRNKRGLV